VPWREWACVSQGFKSEFRAGSGKVSRLLSVPTPAPVVAYTINSLRQYRAALMVLEGCWREPLGAISPESLEAEGYQSFAEFRHAWVIREKRHFPRFAMTTVYRVRPWKLEDARDMADALLRRLYGSWLESQLISSWLVSSRRRIPAVHGTDRRS